MGKGGEGQQFEKSERRISLEELSHPEHQKMLGWPTKAESMMFLTGKTIQEAL